MNLNILGYSIYLIITTVIIVHIGRVCYNNGNTFIQNLIPKDSDVGQQINKMLLIGYYLLNIGYCAMTLVSWSQIQSYDSLIEVIAMKSATIIITISIMHYINIFIITKYINKLI